MATDIFDTTILCNKCGEEMEKTLSDPAQSILALGRYRKNAVAAHSSLRNLNTYFLNNKTAFGDKEPAKFFEFYQ